MRGSRRTVWLPAGVGWAVAQLAVLPLGAIVTTAMRWSAAHPQPGHAAE
ncbi:MAG TPA: hypothetical protein VG651_24600 [Stellaceae bacterium]|nr:hypothetical protein [Stellaceae bacterium]